MLGVNTLAACSLDIQGRVRHGQLASAAERWAEAWPLVLARSLSGLSRGPVRCCQSTPRQPACGTAGFSVRVRIKPSTRTTSWERVARLTGDTSGWAPGTRHASGFRHLVLGFFIKSSV